MRTLSLLGLSCSSGMPEPPSEVGLPDSGHVVPETDEYRNEQTSPPEPHTGIQGEGGVGRDQGREHGGGAGAAFLTCIPTRSRNGRRSFRKGLPGYSGLRRALGANPPPVDVKSLHAKIGEPTRENDFLEVALGKAGLLSAKR